MSQRPRTNGLTEPKQAAMELAQRIAFRAGDRLVGIALGGGLTYRDWVDDTSDLDLFCYVDGNLPDIMSWVRDVAAGEEVHQPRDRGSLLEHRQFVGPTDSETSKGRFDANIKVFPIKTMRRYAFGPVTFDEITLEELHSYSKFQVLADSDNRLTQLLNKFHSRKQSNVATLADIALETYGKELSGAIKQRLFRDDMTGSSMQPTFVRLSNDAINALVCLAYLQSGDYPAPFKWRYHEDFLVQLPNGTEIHRLLQEWTHEPGALEPAKTLKLIHGMEGLIADYSRPPWQRHKADQWWWVNFDPLSMSARASSPYAGESLAVDTRPGTAADGDVGIR